MEVYENNIPSTPKVSSFSVIDLLENYGWHILIGFIIIAYIYEKFLKSIISDIKRKQEDADYSAKYHKNPDLLNARLSAQEYRTQKLQEKYQKDAEQHKKKVEEKEEKKREEIMAKWEGSGHILGSKNDNSDNKNGGSSSTSKSLKSEYNPLMGSGSSSNYRPPRRSACSRGGCG